MFAQPFGFAEIRSHAVHVHMENDEIVMSMYMPMPFWKEANITLVNLSETPVELTLQMTVEENLYIENETGDRKSVV